MTPKLKVGILGCANVVRKHAIPAFKALELVELGGIASRDKEKARSWAREFSIPFSGSYSEIIASENIDLIYIALPTGLHEEWAIKAAHCKKHIICEKSLSDNYESIARVVEACKKNKVALFENFMCAYHPQHQTVRKIVKEDLGGISFFFGCFGIPHLKKDDFRYKKELGGGSLNDLGAYLVLMSKFILQEIPVAVTCSLDCSSRAEVDIRGSALLEFSNHKKSLISFGFGLTYQNNYSVWGSDGLINVNRAFSIPQDIKPDICLTRNQNCQERKIKVELEPSNQFLLGFERFCQIISNKDQESIDRQYAFIIEQGKIMQALRDSAKSGRRVMLI